jgi:hypothetical protein
MTSSAPLVLQALPPILAAAVLLVGFRVPRVEPRPCVFSSRWS